MLASSPAKAGEPARREAAMRRDRSFMGNLSNGNEPQTGTNMRGQTEWPNRCFPVGLWPTTVASHLNIAYRSDPDPSRVFTSHQPPSCTAVSPVAEQHVSPL